MPYISVPITFSFFLLSKVPPKILGWCAFVPNGTFTLVRYWLFSVVSSLILVWNYHNFLGPLFFFFTHITLKFTKKYLNFPNWKKRLRRTNFLMSYFHWSFSIYDGNFTPTSTIPSKGWHYPCDGFCFISNYKLVHPCWKVRIRRCSVDQFRYLWRQKMT